ncbi:MAG: hypothetical protein H7Y31_02510 [Chitinophagaceae bacterium]|nr:hypothetical protein [Chitinophagaceae bacterium]
MQKHQLAFWKVIGSFLFMSAILYACSKGGGSSPAPNPCAGVTISVTGTVTDAGTGLSNGSIAAASTGGSGAMTYSIDGGTFGASSTFNNLAKGAHTVTAKDNKGCTGSKAFTVGETNACAGVNITLTGAATNSDPCAPSGVITATAAGSTGFTYSLGAGAFQASNVFMNIAPGNYTLNVKNAAGCGANSPVTVGAVAAGVLFTAAKGVVQNNCATAGCHSGAAPQGGINFSVDCNIVINKDRIKARAIDGVPSIMPPTGALPQADRDKLTAWINAGGRFTD